MPILDSAVIIAVLIVLAVGATVAWGFGWIARRGGADALSDVAEEVFDSVHAVEFRTAKTAERTINGIRDMALDRRAIVRVAAYLVLASLMALLWLLIGAQVAKLCEPSAVAFIKHGGEIATYKLHLYWHIRMAFGIVGFLLGLVVGEGVYILLRPVIKPE